MEKIETLKFYSMDHRGGLKEALTTKVEITESVFKDLISNYHYYAYDKRINCHRYILNDIEHNNLPVWLLIEVVYE